MKRTKTQKGITLVALIITIIVLLILAMVAIRAIQGDGIIGHAKNARDEYAARSEEENGIIQNYADYITGQLGNGEQITKGDWVQTKTQVKNSKTNQTLEVGQTVTNYTEEAYQKEDGTSGEWIVLGAENGNLLLTTKTNATTLTLTGREGYNTGVAKLTTACENYGKGTGSAETARSIKIDDLDRVTGYNVETADASTKQTIGPVSEYGKTITFSLEADGKIMYSEDGGEAIDSKVQYFFHPDGRIFTKLTEAELEAKNITGYTEIVSEPGEIIKIPNNAYAYLAETLTREKLKEGETAAGIAKSSLAYQHLIAVDEQGADAYWLASPFAHAFEGPGEGLCLFRLGLCSRRPCERSHRFVVFEWQLL